MMFPARQMSVDLEVDPAEAEAAAAGGNAAAQLVRRVFMGHSMGAVSAVAEAIKRPEVCLLLQSKMTCCLHGCQYTCLAKRESTAVGHRS